MNQKIGTITGINGNMLTVTFDGTVSQNEVGYAIHGDERMKSEVLRIQNDRAYHQVFESTKGLKLGYTVD